MKSRSKLASTTKKTAVSAVSNDPGRSAGLRRGLEILCLFSEERPEWGITEIAHQMNLHKSLIHRSIKTLEEMGFLRRDPSSRRYLMGFKTFEVGSLAGRLTNRMAWSRPELRKLARKLKATVSLRLVVDDDLLVVDMIESLTHLPIHIPQGARVPLNYGAGGQVMAAFRADEDSRRLIRKYGLPRFTAKSLTTEKEFFSAVRRVRAHGYAVSEGETRPGYFSVAAPIMGADNLLTAVLVVSSPVGAMTKKEISAFAEVTAEAARRLTRRCHEI